MDKLYSLATILLTKLHCCLVTAFYKLALLSVNSINIVMYGKLCFLAITVTVVR